MKAVYPVTTHNAALYKQLAILFPKMGGNKLHDLYIVSCPAVVEVAQEFADSVKRLFRSVDGGVVSHFVEKTDAGRNMMFRDTAYLLDKAGNAEPWIWMEHAYPTEKDWLEAIQEEWNAKPLDRRFLGCVEKTYFRGTDAEGNVIDPPCFREAGRHMRFGVYPPDFARQSVILHSLGKVPFEIALQDEIVHSCHESKRVQTVWASKHFVATRRGYAGDQSPEWESEIRRNERTSATTDSGLVLLHGCRDGSLGMALTSQHWHDKAGVKPIREATNRSLEEKLEAANAIIAEQRHRIEELQRGLEEKLAGETAETEAADEREVGGEAIPQPSPAPEADGEASGDAESSKSKRVPSKPLFPVVKRGPGRPRKVRDDA